MTDVVDRRAEAFVLGAAATGALAATGLAARAVPATGLAPAGVAAGLASALVAPAFFPAGGAPAGALPGVLADAFGVGAGVVVGLVAGLVVGFAVLAAVVLWTAAPLATEARADVLAGGLEAVLTDVFTGGAALAAVTGFFVWRVGVLAWTTFRNLLVPARPA